MQTIIRIIIASVLFFTFKLNGQNNYNFNTKLTEYLSVQNERINFNGVVLVANSKEILYQRAIGFSSLENKTPLTVGSKFKIASISKSFTGMLVALAVKEGKLKLEDKIKQYFNECTLREKWDEITIQHLISHTSGIPHWKGYKDYWTIKSRLPLNTKQVLTDIFKMDLVFIPGKKVNYSSPAYFLLAVILQKVYGDTYDGILNKKIFKPLKLDNTGAYNDLSIIPKMTSGYHLLPNDSLIVAPYRSSSALKGSGSLYASAKDLLKWNRSLMNDSIWNSELKQSLFNPITDHLMPHNNKAQYGMGWYIHNKKNDRLKSYQASGGTFGYSSISVVYPERKLTLIVLSNISFLPMHSIWSDMEKIILEKPFKLPTIINSSLISIKSLEKFIGTYRASNNMQLKILEHQGKLFAKLGSKPPFRIYTESHSVFFGKKVGVRFTFNVLSDNKTVTGLKTEGKGKEFKFKKL
ncbi:serine hydrolase [Flavivirga algicola]|uniref:Serine hydrolase n=1 Tax=Flavivirga algicola TaxID=2729136 RepID=A0ABX1RW67_9FLAO|nr:serine hydrolase [Flavivirga algicola]NMH86998.1 serine hydrolase [Flavivirga algicola]